MAHKRRPPEGFGERLRDAWYKSGYSLTELENKTGINHGSISRYMSEEMAPTVITLAILCKTLRVSADYLLFGGKICDT